MKNKYFKILENDSLVLIHLRNHKENRRNKSTYYQKLSTQRQLIQLQKKNIKTNNKLSKPIYMETPYFVIKTG